jgi:hypothetical protein
MVLIYLQFYPLSSLLITILLLSLQPNYDFSKAKKKGAYFQETAIKVENCTGAARFSGND